MQDGKLFYLETSDVEGAVKEHSLKELHTMMGHCNVHDLRQLERTVDGIRITDPGSEFFCDICARGKQTHEQINKKPDPRATSPLELVHSDLAGPVSPAAKGSFRWAICLLMTILDLFVTTFYDRNLIPHRPLLNSWLMWHTLEL